MFLRRIASESSLHCGGCSFRGRSHASATPRAASDVVLHPLARPRRLRRLPRETFDFLHDKRSVRPIDLQQVLGLAVLHDPPHFQEDDPIEIP
jgi:hypothetical protein